jgi:hypothetical protein
MKRPTLAVCLGTLLMVLTSQASAQQRDSGCQGAANEQQMDLEIARAWPPIGLGLTIAKKACKAETYLKDLFQRQPDPDKVTANQIFEADKPDGLSERNLARAAPRFRGALVGSRLPERLSDSSSSSTNFVTLAPSRPGGEASYFQPRTPLAGPPPTQVSEIRGEGTLISAEGLKRGTFKDGKLDGPGEEIDPDGVWRSATYDRGKYINRIWEVRTIGGKTYIAAGIAVDGKLNGMVERVFADGSTQYEEWAGGRMIQVGVRGARGSDLAIAPQPRAGSSTQTYASGPSSTTQVYASNPSSPRSRNTSLEPPAGRIATRAVSQSGTGSSLDAQITPHQLGWLRACEPEMQLVLTQTIGGVSDPIAMRQRTSKGEVEFVQKLSDPDLRQWIARGPDRDRNPVLLLDYCLAKARLSDGLNRGHWERH